MTIVSRPLITSIVGPMMSEAISSPSMTTAGVIHLPMKKHTRERWTPSATTLFPSCKSTLATLARFASDSCFSLSEFGCVDTVSGRKFGEIPTLYSDKMTGVYSGGLVYEYTKEADATQQKYGLVEVESTSSVTERPDFALLQNALKDNQPPSGDGGYKPNAPKSDCPGNPIPGLFQVMVFLLCPSRLNNTSRTVLERVLVLPAPVPKTSALKAPVLLLLALVLSPVPVALRLLLRQDPRAPPAASAHRNSLLHLWFAVLFS